MQLADPKALAKIARDHEVTGGQIVNIVRYVCLLAVRRDTPPGSPSGTLIITAADLIAGIRRERRKEGPRR